MYEVTIRNRWGNKIVRRVEVDDLSIPLSEVLQQGLRESRTQFLAQQFISKHGRSVSCSHLFLLEPTDRQTCALAPI